MRPRRHPRRRPDQPTKNKGPALGAQDGRDKQISASEMAMLNGASNRG